MFKCIPRFCPSLDWGSLRTVLKLVLFNRLNSFTKEQRSEFENSFAKYIGSRNAVSVASGRMGIYLILKNLDLKKGAEVILPSFTYWVIPEVVRFLKLQPVFVDIDPYTCNMDSTLLESKINPRTAVIVPTHLYGLPCDMKTIMEVARRHNLFVIEDCVQAAGAEYNSKKVGSIGDAAYFSFGITKNMPLLGGGIVVTNDDVLAKKIKRDYSELTFLRKTDILKRIGVSTVMKICTSRSIFTIVLYPLIFLFGLFKKDLIGKIFSESESFSEKFLGAHAKLVPPLLQDRIGIKVLEELGQLNNKRIYNGTYFIAHMNKLNQIILPRLFEKHIFSSFVIRTKKRDMLIWELLKKGIDTTTGYIQAFGEDCQNAKLLEREILHLPIYPSLTDSELLYICNVFNRVAEKISVA